MRDDNSQQQQEHQEEQQWKEMHEEIESYIPFKADFMKFVVNKEQNMSNN